jgi:hypothetical protein
MTQEGVRQLDDAAARIHAWNPRKRPFTNRQINIAASRLLEHGWIGNRSS